MSAVLNTNIASLWASKNLLGAQNKLAASVERLSSGLRINRARDDAAGLGVANSLTAQINGANQGMRNLNDAISMVQTAEGAIAAASEMGQRILMLATQAANSTLGSTERRAIITEMQQLISSIDSISERTKFTGNPLLNGAVGSTATLYSMQISNNADDTISMETQAFANIGSGASSQGFALLSSAVGGTTAANQTVTIGAQSLTTAVADTTHFKLQLADGSFENVSVLWTKHGTTAADATVVITGAVSGAKYLDGKVGDLSSVKIFSRDAGTGHAGDLASSIATALSVLNQYDAGTKTSSDVTSAFQTVQTDADSYVIALGTQRSQLGAYQNQMEYTLSNITELSSNLQSARSRVIDTDYASETASLTKGQILQQAATAMLAQANQMPNVILTLLK